MYYHRACGKAGGHEVETGQPAAMSGVSSELAGTDRSAMKRTVIDVDGIVSTAVEPETSNGRVLFCLPGGGMSRRYFDLDNRFSMSEHLATRGFTVVSIDHPGVGDSPPPDDPWTLTTAYVADRDAAAVADLRSRYPGFAIGVGHSMGAMLTIIAQAHHSCYDALALLGWAHGEGYRATPLAGFLSTEEAAIVGDGAAIDAAVVELARRRFRIPRPIGSTTTSAFLLGATTPDEGGLQALAASKTNLLAVCGLAAMLNGNAEEVARIDVPLFVAVGEHDITTDLRSTAPALRACPDISLFVLPGAAHNHNIAPNRTVLWDRLAGWAEGLP
jgi:pimeloyl-ACP methyl ester carboxylesterase